MEKVTVREIIEMLAKGDWDQELTVITESENAKRMGEFLVPGRKITGIAHTPDRVAIVVEDTPS